MGAARPRAAELSPEVPLPAVPFVLEEGAAAEPDAEPEADAEPETDAEEFADADAEAAALSDTEAIMIEYMLAMNTRDCVRTNQRNGTLTRGATRDSDAVGSSSRGALCADGGDSDEEEGGDLVGRDEHRD